MDLRDKCVICKMKTLGEITIERNGNDKDLPCCQVCVGKYGRLIDKTINNILDN